MENDTKRMTPRFWLMLGLVAAAAALRIVPHPPNFAPVAAMALFGGAYFDRKRWAFAVPLAAMLLSDAALELLFGWGFHSGMPAVYGTFALIVCLGFLLRERKTAPLPVAGAALASSTLFYLTTNFSVWLTSGMYAATPAGLAACYAAAIPFFGPTLAGDLFYTAAMFGALALAERRFPVFATAPQA
jgi:hypothetical protein